VSVESWEELLPRDELFSILESELARRGAGSVHEAKPDCVEGSLGNAWSAEQYSSHDYPGAIEGFIFACFALRLLAMNHCLVDGNKRLAWIAFTTVLATLGLTVNATEEEAANFVSRIILEHLDGAKVVEWTAGQLSVLTAPPTLAT